MSPVAKSPPEEKLLRTLWRRGALSRAAAKAEAETVRRLLAAKLIEELPGASIRAAPKLVLTEAGRAAAAKLPPTSPTQLSVFRQVAMLREELQELRRFVAECLRPTPEEPAVPQPTPSRPPPPATPQNTNELAAEGPCFDHFGRRFLETLAVLDRTERHGGLVPLPRLRHALRDMGLSRAAFDDAVLALEEQYVIDLKVANEPSRLADRDQGIESPDRGLLYFVVTR